MEQFEIQQAVDRIGRMELIFDLLQKVAGTNPAALQKNMLLQELLWTLTEYYEGGQWLRDYALDEKGFFPRGLKRGVLAQDALYDFFEQVKNGEEPQHPSCRFCAP